LSDAVGEAYDLQADFQI